MVYLYLGHPPGPLRIYFWSPVCHAWCVKMITIDIFSMFNIISFLNAVE